MNESAGMSSTETQKQTWTGLGNLEESTTMPPFFFLPKHFISVHRKREEEHLIPIQTRMILVILLSCNTSSL